MPRASVKPKRREKRQVAYGRAYVQSTFNNTIVSITDANGEVITWASSGSVGFKGTRKGTPYAARMVAEAAAKKAMEQAGVRRVDEKETRPFSSRLNVVF